MTDSDIIRAVAELDGWEYTHFPDMGNGDGYGWVKGEMFPQNALPISECNYLTSYDAIIPVVQKQNYSTRLKMSPISFMTKPNKIAEALLRATNKWTTK